MTVESALRDWYEYRTNNGAMRGVKPDGYMKLGTGDANSEPYYLGYCVVERASSRLPTPLAAAFAFCLLSGGTKETFLEEAHRARVVLFGEIKRVIEEWSERIANDERGRDLDD